MKNKIRWFHKILIGMMFLSLAGCRPVLSVDAYYKQDQVVSDPALLGRWENRDDETVESWTFSMEKDGALILVYKTSHETIPFAVHVFQLGDERLLDLYPHLDDKDAEQRFDVIPMHLLMRYQIKEKTLYFSVMNEEWLKEKISKNEIQLSHKVLEDQAYSDSKDKDLLLTATTDELQKFLTDIVFKDPQGFGETTEAKLVEEENPPAGH